MAAFLISFHISLCQLLSFIFLKPCTISSINLPLPLLFLLASFCYSFSFHSFNVPYLSCRFVCRFNCLKTNTTKININNLTWPIEKSSAKTLYFYFIFKHLLSILINVPSVVSESWNNYLCLYIVSLDSIHYEKFSLTWVFSKSFSVPCAPLSVLWWSQLNCLWWGSFSGL